MAVECPHPECDDKYQRLGRHWAGSPQHRPEISNKQHEIITGIMMGDGSIHKDRDNPRLEVVMTNKEYLEHINQKFGTLTTGVRLRKTAAEAAQRSRERGFSPLAKEENYSDQYIVRTRRNPELKKYLNWYDTGEKVWPENIDLTPTTLKHWYCCDGYLETNAGGGKRISISMVNEKDNLKKVESMFSCVGLPKPTNWDKRKRESGQWDCAAYWTEYETKILLQYMGSALPGFEYKWPDEKKFGGKK